MVYNSPPWLRLAVLASFIASGASAGLAQAARATGSEPAETAASAAPATAEELADDARKAYAKRLTQEKIDGHYIPSDVLDALRELDKITSTTSQTSYASRPEDFVVKKLYFSFGRWMGVNWGLYDGSRLSAHLRDLGVDQPDGQIELLMRMYHRHLTGKDLDVKELAMAYKEKRALEDTDRMRRATVIDSFTRSEPKPAAGNRPRG